MNEFDPYDPISDAVQAAATAPGGLDAAPPHVQAAARDLGPAALNGGESEPDFDAVAATAKIRRGLEARDRRAELDRLVAQLDRRVTDTRNALLLARLSVRRRVAEFEKTVAAEEGVAQLDRRHRLAIIQMEIMNETLEIAKANKEVFPCDD